MTVPHSESGKNNCRRIEVPAILLFDFKSKKYPVSVIGKQGFRTKENIILRSRPAVLISAGLRTHPYNKFAGNAEPFPWAEFKYGFVRIKTEDTEKFLNQIQILYRPQFQ